MSRRLYLSIAILVVLLGCVGEAGRPAKTSDGLAVDAVPVSPESRGNGFVAAAGESPAEGAGQFLPAGSITIGQPTTMIIRTGQAHVRVDSLAPALSRVRQLALRSGGYVAGSTIQNGASQVHSATLELKLPADRYDEAMVGLTGIGRLLSSSTTAQDVGEEYVDVSARTENAHRLEERLVGLLGTRTGKLSDVLSVERELARVREEIERYQGRLRYLRSHAEMSTLAITISEPPPLVGPGANPIAEAARQAWRNFVAVVAGGIAALGVVLPLAVLGVGALLLWRRRRRPVASRA